MKFLRLTLTLCLTLVFMSGSAFAQEKVDLKQAFKNNSKNEKKIELNLKNINTNVRVHEGEKKSTCTKVECKSQNCTHHNKSIEKNCNEKNCTCTHHKKTDKKQCTKNCHKPKK